MNFLLFHHNQTKPSLFYFLIYSLFNSFNIKIQTKGGNQTPPTMKLILQVRQIKYKKMSME